MKKTILLVFIIGLLIRLILLGSDYYQGDVNMHIKWAKDVVEHGSAGFYDRNRNIVGTIYPPVAIYIFALIYWLYLWLNKAIWFLNINIPVFPSQLVFF